MREENERMIREENERKRREDEGYDMHSSYGSGSRSYYRHHRPRRVRKEVKSE